MYVYLLKSYRNPQRRYVGLTNDLNRRLEEHNRGESKAIRQHKPYRLVVSLWFDNAAKVEAFEKYLKAGNGHTFAKKHFW